MLRCRSTHSGRSDATTYPSGPEAYASRSMRARMELADSLSPMADVRYRFVADSRGGARRGRVLKRAYWQSSTQWMNDYRAVYPVQVEDEGWIVPTKIVLARGSSRSSVVFAVLSSIECTSHATS